MSKTVRLQPDADGQVVARFRQHGVTVDYATLSHQDVAMLGEIHDLTGPIELTALHMLQDLDEKKQETAPTMKRSTFHSILNIFSGAHRFNGSTRR